MTNDEAILEHQKAEQEAKKWQERERELRTLIYGNLFGSKGCEDGKTHTHELGNGYKLKAKRPINYKLDRDLCEVALDAISGIGNEGSFIADRLVKWEPKLSVSEYAKLSPQYKAEIDKALTTTPGLPTLEFIAPKGAE